MGHADGLRREPQNSTVPTLRFTRNFDTWNSLHHIGGTYSQNCSIEALGYAISELHVGQFLDPDDFHYLRVNFNTDVCVGVHSSFS